MTRRGLPAFAQLRSRTMFDTGVWYAMMFAYLIGAVCGIAAFVSDMSWLGAFGLMCLLLGSLIESREWHRYANSFAYLAFVKERTLEAYRSQTPYVRSGRN